MLHKNSVISNYCATFIEMVKVPSVFDKTNHSKFLYDVQSKTDAEFTGFKWKERSLRESVTK